MEAVVFAAATSGFFGGLLQLASTPAGYSAGAIVLHSAMFTVVFFYVGASMQAGSVHDASQQLMAAAAGWLVGPLLAGAACGSADTCSDKNITYLVLALSLLCAAVAGFSYTRRPHDGCGCGCGCGDGDGDGDGGGKGLGGDVTAELLELANVAVTFGADGNADIAPDDPAYHDPEEVIGTGKRPSVRSNANSSKPIVHVAINTAF